MAMLNTVVDQIGRMNAEELNRAVDAIKLRRTYLARQAANEMVKGDMVQFRKRDGQTVRGRITKVNQKTVVVDTGTVTWKVTASMLSPVS